MTDHEWLAKVLTAYKEYCRQYPNEELPARLFVKWLYQQYGIVFNDKQGN